MFVEIRSKKGKLLFKWDPQTNTVNIVLKDILYSVKLNNLSPSGEYEILSNKNKYETNK